MAIGSFQGPSSNIFTKSKITKFSNRVVTTSSTFIWVLRTTGTNKIKQPANAPAINNIGIMIGEGKSITPVPTKVAAIAPQYNCPSAPIFQNFARNATAAAKPVKINGVALAKDSVIAKVEPKEPLIKAI